MTESHNNKENPTNPSKQQSPIRKLSKRFPAAWPAPPPSTDCDRPACAEIGKALQEHGFGGDLNSFLSNQAAINSSNISSSIEAKQCPPNSAELGVGTWKLLHSMVAWYPDQPTTEDRQHMTNFITALARFYPCTWCAQDFQENVVKSPVKTESRKDLSVWLCEQHNVVNQKLGKPVFPCDMDSLDERWRKSKNSQCNH